MTKDWVLPNAPHDLSSGSPSGEKQRLIWAYKILFLDAQGPVHGQLTRDLLGVVGIIAETEGVHHVEVAHHWLESQGAVSTGCA